MIIISDTAIVVKSKLCPLQTQERFLNRSVENSRGEKMRCPSATLEIAIGRKSFLERHAADELILACVSHGNYQKSLLCSFMSSLEAEEVRFVFISGELISFFCFPLERKESFAFAQGDVIDPLFGKILKEGLLIDENVGKSNFLVYEEDVSRKGCSSAEIQCRSTSVLQVWDRLCFLQLISRISELMGFCHTISFRDSSSGMMREKIDSCKSL